MQSRQLVEQRVQLAIKTYSEHLRASNAHHSEQIRRSGDQFLDVLTESDGFQAQLVVIGALLCGARITEALLDAARAIQMIHCTFDEDIVNSPAAAIGLHAAEITLANLDAPADLRLKVLSITNRSLLLKAQADASAGNGNPDLLATEAVLNPLHVGMVLTGADCDATDAITQYALAAGRYYVTGNSEYLEGVRDAYSRITFWNSVDLQLLADVLANTFKNA